MGKTLHLIEPGAAGCGPCTMAAVGNQASIGGDRVVVLGGRRDAQWALEAGCVVDRTVPLPLGQPRLARRSLSAAWKAGGESKVIAWSERAAAAVATLPGEVEAEARLAAAVGPIPWVEPWWRRRVEVRPIGMDAGPVLARRGWRVGEVLEVSELARPAKSEMPRRASLRREWEADDDELVIACVADPPSSLDLVVAYGAAVVCSTSGRKVRLIAHPGCGRGMVARTWARSLQRQGPPLTTPLIMDERLEAPWLVADGVDLLLMISPRGSGPTASACSLMPFAWWFAAGVPAVANWTRGVEAVLRDGVDGRLVPEGSRNEVAAVLMRICDQPDLLASSGDAAAARWHAAGSTAFD
ncbi:MAG: hypothetical protein MK085_12485 [Phycisphaerales bacterium]|nr:hypothetical protein [Phycisphaerales bacterium]